MGGLLSSSSDGPGLRRPARVAILGSTGSVGRQTLDVIRSHADRFEVVGLAAGRNIDLLCEQIAEFRPSMICCRDSELLRARLADGPAVAPRPARPSTSSGQADEASRGTEASLVSLSEMATDPEVDIVVSAIVGGDGLLPTIAALSAGKPVALANKEALVMAGSLVAAAAANGGGSIRPVDSEHSAIWQCLDSREPESVRRLLITASGGALRDLSPEELSEVTPERALAHPTWVMGPRITVDSATLFNKGLEVIEARWLFDVPYERIDVLMHRESIIHSMVELVDGSMLAQLSMPDMRLPIQYALTYPERLSLDLPAVDFARLGALHFGAPDLERYPCLGLALNAAREGGTMPAALAAADEAGVEAFIAGRIGFMDIPNLLADTLSSHVPVANPCLEDVLDADRSARAFATEWIASRR